MPRARCAQLLKFRSPQIKKAFVTARFDKASKLWFVSQENFARHMIENLNIRVTYIADDADEEEDDD